MILEQGSDAFIAADSHQGKLVQWYSEQSTEPLGIYYSRDHLVGIYPCSKPIVPDELFGTCLKSQLLGGKGEMVS